MKRLVFLTFALALSLSATLTASADGNSAQQAAAQTSAPIQAPSDGVARITLDEFKTLLAASTPLVVIDVRGGINEKIKGAVNVPLNDIETRLDEIPRDREIVTYCA